MENKNKILKKIVSVSLCAAILCSTAAFTEAVGFVGAGIGCITARAATETPASSFEYEVNDDGGIIITKFTGSETDIVIPSVIDGRPVTCIDYDAFYHCAEIMSVVIPDSVINIHESAFSGCTALRNVNLPNNLKCVDMAAFSMCESLTSISIPDSVTSIGDSAFYGCRGLTSVYIPERVTQIGWVLFRTVPDL